MMMMMALWALWWCRHVIKEAIIVPTRVDRACFGLAEQEKSTEHARVCYGKGQR
jgi:hypothetical protein